MLACFADPAEILRSLADDGTSEVREIRQHAVAALTPDDHLFDGVTGQPKMPQPPTVSMMKVLVAR